MTTEERRAEGVVGVGEDFGGISGAGLESGVSRVVGEEELFVEAAGLGTVDVVGDDAFERSVFDLAAHVVVLEQLGEVERRGLSVERHQIGRRRDAVVAEAER